MAGSKDGGFVKLYSQPAGVSAVSLKQVYPEKGDFDPASRLVTCPSKSGPASGI
jgi:hypothetical protein